MARQESLGWRDTVMPMLGLFSSLGTLVCCVLPLVFVSLGMGAALVGLVSAAPWLVWLSAHKVWVFVLSALMLSLSWFAVWRQRYVPCPSDRRLALACQRLRTFSWWMVGIATGLYVLGFTVAIILPKIIF
ncbi:MAG TPA: hypothetical protein VHP58_01455 [Alphaproteobacteria bacterium]|nr:hypothetical protein [Alphaproteobacteria bacterium]